MSRDPDLLAISAVVMMGFVVLWANPGRTINRIFCTVALHVSLWLLCVHFAVVNGEDSTWILRASMVGAFMPAHMWFLKEASAGHGDLRRRMYRKLPWWLAGACLLTLFCFSQNFVRAPLTPGGAPRFGLAYFGFVLGFVGMFALLWRETVKQIRTLSGSARLELQIILLGGSAAAFAIILLMALRAVLGVLWPIHLQPVVVIVFYTGTAVAITTHRVFDARQIIIVGTQKFILVSVAAAFAFVVDRALGAAGVPGPIALFLTAAVALWLAGSLHGWLDRAFEFYPGAKSARLAAFAAAREMRVEALERAFVSLLKGWGQSERALILSGAQGVLAGQGIELDRAGSIVTTMRQLRWATPERLGRERSSPEREEIARFLDTHGLGVLAICEGPTLMIMVGVGVSASRLPITYPQVTELIELASIMEGAFERAHFSAKAQHAEQLATVGLLGASLAHEIRNPLVSIKTFVQLLPKHHQDAAFRDKFFRLIGDEVARIDQLTEQLLDLASPRAYMAGIVELHPILRASIDLVSSKAVHRNVELLTDFAAEPDKAYTDASAAKQVMLNLCFNAIQAVEAKDGERWVRVSTRNVVNGVEMAVEDSGPGIAPEMRPRLFQPFQTSKSTGFGLGLAICSDILNKLNATISVDPPVPGRGAAFRVIFPCQPLSS